MTLRLHRPDEGGLVRVVPDPREEWRAELHSGAWRDRRRWPSRIVNPDAKPTSTLAGAVLFATLAALTFVLLVALYGSGAFG